MLKGRRKKTSHTGEPQCKICGSAQPIRSLAERLRSVGISTRDIADFLTSQRDFPISHSAAARHDAHFSVEDIQNSPLVNVPTISENGEISITKIAKHKLAKYWETQADVVPNDREAREWGKLLLDAAKTGNEEERTALLRRLFTGGAPRALPDPSVIEGEVVEVLN